MQGKMAHNHEDKNITHTLYLIGLTKSKTNINSKPFDLIVFSKINACPIGSPYFMFL
jgi:hypothetical protein